MEDSQFELVLLAGGMATSPVFGNLSQMIRDQGFVIHRELKWEVWQQQPWRQCGSATVEVGEAIHDLKPDALLLLGDRFETAAAALAATVARVPIAHLYGGEETTGAFDNSLRHAITKLSHLHLVAHGVYAKRIVQMGEDPDWVHIVGSLGVENVLRLPPISRKLIEARIGRPLSATVGLVTVHPTTLSTEREDAVVDAVLAALAQIDITWIVTLPNSDPGSEVIRERLSALATRRPNIVVVDAFGEEYYVGVMRHCAVVLGNSSSGMTEAPALGVPTVNVGERQEGRLRFPSIVDVRSEPGAVVDAVRHVMSPAFASRRKPNLSLGDANVSQRICGVLREWQPSRQKAFHDLRFLADTCDCGDSAREKP